MTKISGPRLQLNDDTLLNEAANFLRQNKGTLPDIAADIGIPIRFFYDLTAGRVNNPGVRPIEKILQYKRLVGETVHSGLLS